MPKTKPQSAELKVTMDPSVIEMLTEPMRDLVQKAIDVMRHEKRGGMPIQRVHLSKFVDPETENWEEVVFEVKLSCGEKEAIAHWGRLSEKVHRLTEGFSESDRAQLENRIAVGADWE